MQQARQFGDYAAALILAYEEEVVGEAYFDALASRFEGPARRALRLLARIEALCADVLRPAVERRGLATAAPSGLRARGRAEARAKDAMAWPALVAEMAADFPAFVEEFEAIERLAPESEKPLIGILIEHEIAAVAFARRAAAGAPESLAPLEAFIAAHESGAADG